MSLESFFGSEGGEGMSEGALEALREKMAAAAAQMAAARKEEGKQKKTEEELLRILYKFVKTSQKQELVLLISRVLEQNIPANFVLAVILLGNPDIQNEVGKFLMLYGTASHATETLPGDNISSEQEKSLIFFTSQDYSLPLKIRIELDHWVKNMLFQAQEKPEKLIKTAYKVEMHELPKEYEWEESQYETKITTKTILIQLITYVIRDFLTQNAQDEPYDKLYDFAEFLLNGILTKTKEEFENRKLLN